MASLWWGTPLSLVARTGSAGCPTRSQRPGMHSNDGGAAAPDRLPAGSVRTTLSAGQCSPPVAVSTLIGVLVAGSWRAPRLLPRGGRFPDAPPAGGRFSTDRRFSARGRGCSGASELFVDAAALLGRGARRPAQPQPGPRARARSGARPSSPPPSPRCLPERCRRFFAFQSELTRNRECVGR